MRPLQDIRRDRPPKLATSLLCKQARYVVLHKRRLLSLRPGAQPLTEAAVTELNRLECDLSAKAVIGIREWVESAVKAKFGAAPSSWRSWLSSGFSGTFPAVSFPPQLHHCARLMAQRTDCRRLGLQWYIRVYPALVYLGVPCSLLLPGAMSARNA